MSCRPTEPVATPPATRTPILPTATLTPIPTSTATATPTNTPTPTPTLPPGLALAPTATRAESCPATTADLFFLREGRVWVCPADGGLPERLPAAEEIADVAVVAFDVLQDGRTIAYVTAKDELWVLDRGLWEHTHVPTSGRLLSENEAHFAFSDDGSTLIYLAWGVQVSSGPMLETERSGVLLSASVLTPKLRQQELATCRASVSHPCQGFLVSPDESQLAYVDGQGVWLLTLPPDEGPRLLATPPAAGVRLHSWSPDGAWLLLETTGGVDKDVPPAYALLSASAASASLPLMRPMCTTACDSEIVWATSADGIRLWMTWDDGTQGCVGSLDPYAAGAMTQSVVPGNRICEAQTLALHPSSPMAGPSAVAAGGLVTFYQRAAPGVAAGIYALTSQAELRGVALLPDTQGTVSWSPDGGAFLYTVQNGAASHLGSLHYGVLWDVRDLFTGAHTFIWRSRAQD
ncbi:MAG: hypothetical protein MUQ30_05385 [Anaerolineae bacterium]|nr:hypothetical protein [Anaerolineae bacterium]